MSESVRVLWIETSVRHPLAQRFVEAVRSADAAIVASPGYHGSMSGMIKNALVYSHESDPRRPRPEGHGAR
jgi:FMN reductase